MLLRLYCHAYLGSYVSPRVLDVASHVLLFTCCRARYMLPRMYYWLHVAARVSTRVFGLVHFAASVGCRIACIVVYIFPRMLSRAWLHPAARILIGACCHTYLSLFARVLSMLPLGGAGMWPRTCHRVLGMHLAKRVLPHVWAMSPHVFPPCNAMIDHCTTPLLCFHEH